VKEKRKITNKEYQTLNLVSKRTATNDLSELVEKYELFNQLGASVSTYYELK
jgi:ATP-dependent DNA helicase RecG